MIHDTFPRIRTILVGLVICGITLSTTSCSRGPSPEELPPLPTPHIVDAMPTVRLQIEQALQEARDNPTQTDANGKLAMTLHAYLYLDAAQAAYLRTRVLAPREARWAYLHGLMLEQQGQSTLAADEFRTAVALDSSDVPARLALARNLDVEGKLAEAKDILEDVIATNPNSVEVHYELGLVLSHAGEFRQAVAHLQRALQLGGPFGTGYYALANAYRGMGLESDAASALENYARHRQTSLLLTDAHMAAVRALDQSNVALMGRAKAAYAKGNIDEAIATLEQAISNDPNDVIAHATVMTLYAEAARYTKVDEHYRIALAIDPNLAELHYNLGIARQFEKRNVEAIAAFEKALELDPYSPDTHTRIGMIYHAQGRKKNAIKALNNALTVSPDYVPARRLLADIYYEDEQFEQAASQWAQLIAEPGEKTPLVLRRLARCYMNMEQTELAKATLSEALQIVDRTSDSRLATGLERDLERANRATSDNTGER